MSKADSMAWASRRMGPARSEWPAGRWAAWATATGAASSSVTSRLLTSAAPSPATAPAKCGDDCGAGLARGPGLAAGRGTASALAIAAIAERSAACRRDRTEPAGEGVLMGWLYRPGARESLEYSLGHGPIGLTRTHQDAPGPARTPPRQRPCGRGRRSARPRCR